MPLLDDINRLLRDHTGYTGDGQGGVGPLPVGDRSTARFPINKRDLRELLIGIAQSMGDPSALDEILDQLDDKADLANSGAFFPSRDAMVSAGQSALPGSKTLAFHPDGDYLVVRSAFTAADDPLFPTAPRWGVITRLPSSVIVDGKAALANSGAIYPSRTAAVDAGQSAIPPALGRIITLEGTAIVIRGPGATATDPLFGSYPSWGVISRHDANAIRQNGTLITLSGVGIVGQDPNALTASMPAWAAGVTPGGDVVIEIIATAANTGPVTLVIDGGTARPLRMGAGAELPAGYLQPGRSYLFRWRAAGGGQWRALAPEQYAVAEALRVAGSIPLANVGGTGDAITADLNGVTARIGVAVGTALTVEYIPAATNSAANPTITIEGTVFAIRDARGGTWPAGAFEVGRSYRLQRRSNVMRVTGGDAGVPDLARLDAADAAETAARIAGDSSITSEMRDRRVAGQWAGNFASTTFPAGADTVIQRQDTSFSVWRSIAAPSDPDPVLHQQDATGGWWLRIWRSADIDAALSTERLDRITSAALMGNATLTGVAGTANAITAEVPPQLIAAGIAPGNLREITWLAHATNTATAVTINVGGVGAVNLRGPDNQPLEIGAIRQGLWQRAVKNGAVWNLTTPELRRQDLREVADDLALTDGRVDELRVDLRREPGSPNVAAVTDPEGREPLALDPLGGLHLPGLGGKSVQDHIHRLRRGGGGRPGGGSDMVQKVDAPALSRMRAAQNAVYEVTDLFGGLHVPGGAGRSVQERVRRIEQTQREQARKLRTGLMLDAVQDLGLDRTGKYPVDRKIAEVMAKIRSQPRYYGQRATIYWPEGDYRIAESIDVLSGISHVGAGDGTRFLPYAQHAAFRYYSAVGNFLEHCLFAHFTIEGENQTLQPGGIYWSRIKGFFFRRWRHCAISNVKLYNTGATSIGNDHADRCLIQSCYVENGGRLATVGTFGASGIGIGTGVLLREELIVANNMAIGCKNYSTFVERQANTDYDSQGAIFVGNILKGSNYGFGEAGCDGTIVVGNEMRQNISGGVALHGGTVNGAHPGSRTRFADNQIIGNGGPGIKWDSSGGAGLRGYSSDGNRIEGNAGPGHQITGHVSEVTDDMAIRGDEIISNGGRGIDVQSGQFTNFDVIGTRLLNNDPGGIRLNGSIRGGRIFGASIRDLREADATQVESITGAGALTDFDIGEVQGVGCAPIDLTGPQTRVTFGRNPGLE